MNNAQRGPRVVVNHPAKLLGANGQSLDCTILDVSRDGFRLRVPRALPTGSDYRLSFDNETHRIDIRWTSPTEAGGLFLELSNDD